MSIANLSPLISLAALVVSLLTAWFTLFRRGTVRCTHPSLLVLSYEGKRPRAKVFLRTLLFSTGKRGCVVESLSLRVRQGTRHEEFSFWGHGNNTAELMGGSGLFVPDSGVVTNHHFNPADSAEVFLFSGGTYDIELFAKVFGKKSLRRLWSTSIEVPINAYGAGVPSSTMLLYSWSPEQNRYVASVEERTGHSQSALEPRGLTPPSSGQPQATLESAAHVER